MRIAFRPLLLAAALLALPAALPALPNALPAATGRDARLAGATTNESAGYRTA